MADHRNETALTFQDAVHAIERERERRHWTIQQWKDDAPDEHWPTYIADTRKAADDAADWLIEALRQYGSHVPAHRPCSAGPQGPRPEEGRPEEVTKRQMETIVRTWQTRLRLDHWDITTEYVIPCDDSCDATITIQNDYLRAKIRFDRVWSTWKREQANRVIVHELLHVHEHGLHMTSDPLEGLLGQTAYAVYRNRFNHERERLVDALAVILVDLAGCA